MSRVKIDTEKIQRFIETLLSSVTGAVVAERMVIGEIEDQQIHLLVTTEEEDFLDLYPDNEAVTAD